MPIGAFSGARLGGDDGVEEALEEPSAVRAPAKKHADARSRYADGYSEALSLAEGWPWEALDWLAEEDFGWDGIDEDQNWPEFPDRKNSTSDEALVYYPSYLRELLENTAMEEGKLFKLGMQQALRDIWRAVVDVDASRETKS